MISTKKTLDYLLSSPSGTTHTSDTNKNTKKKQKQGKKGDRNPNPPPTIPPSPKTKADETCATDLLLRKFELDASNETWLQNTISNPLFHTNNTLTKHIKQFNLNNNKYKYNTLISHSKLKISELLSEHTSLHIVTNFTDIGCPCIKNPNVKKGCWCIEQMKKIKPKPIKIKQTIKPTSIHSLHTHMSHNNNIQQQIVMDYFKNFGVSNININQNNNQNNSVDIVQRNLILNASRQQYMNSNRMQQIRMQQMLLNARTNNKTNTNTKTNSHSILGVRTHKDTIVFNNNKSKNGNEPPVKRRKKTRWSDK